MKTAFYAGSFDPFHIGHLDVVTQAGEVFDTVVVVVANNPDKKHLFSLQQRVEIVGASTPLSVRVVAPLEDELTADLAHRISYDPVLIRGLRIGITAEEMDYEADVRTFNEGRGLHTVFFQSHYQVSSSRIRTNIDSDGFCGVPHGGRQLAKDFWLENKVRKL